jgi:hypothetical protein
MRLKAVLVVLAGGFLLLAGLRPDAMPFIPDGRFSDAATSHWPAAFHLRESIFTEGAFPLWQNTILAGSPFAANPLNKTAYPFQWLALVLPPAPFLNLMIVLHLFLAGWGMYRWMRALDLPEYSAILSAIAYTFAPKLLAHLGAGHLDLLYAMAWWPFLMNSIHRLVVPQFQGLDTRAILIIRTSILFSLLFLADVRLSLFAFTLTVTYFIFNRQQRTPSVQQLVSITAIVALFGLLTLSLTVPLLMWQPYLSRVDMTPADAGLFSVEPGQFIGLLLPPHGGNPETMLYLGLPVLLLALIAIFANPRQHLFWIVSLIVAILYTLGINSPFWLTLVQLVPPLLWFRVPARAWFVVVLVMSVLAGYGLRVVITTAERLRQEDTLSRLAIKRLALAGFIGASLLCGGFTLGVMTELKPTIGLGVMVVGALLGIVLLLTLYKRLTPEQIAVLMVLLTLGDLGWTGRAWLEWRTPDRWLTHQDVLVTRLRAELDEQSIPNALIYSPNYALEQQVAFANGLHLFYGVDPFQLRAKIAAIEQASGIPNTGYSVIQPPLPEVEDDEDLLHANCEAQPNLDLLAEWGVYFIVSTCPLNLELADTVDNIYVYRNPAFVSQPIGTDNPRLPQNKGLEIHDIELSWIDGLTEIAALLAALNFLICATYLVWNWRRHA